MDISKAHQELQENGYAVIEDVISLDECDKFKERYQKWAHTLFGDPDKLWPRTDASLIQQYKAGNLESSWEIRLKVKPVFASLFGTDKLLSSTDAIAIGRPPEDGKTKFAKSEYSDWLHLDQSGRRIGHHAYQSGIYLEDADEDDWTLQVMEKSHRYHQEFFDTFPDAIEYMDQLEYYELNKEQVEWYRRQGCTFKRITVPKGGMVLWDSRTVHANAQPIEGRKHPGRWRYVVFVCMTPAIWASSEDMEKKKMAYQNLNMTTHWPSQGVTIFRESSEEFNSITELPEVAKSNAARLLSGDLEYDFNDEKPNGPSAPKWK